MTKPITVVATVNKNEIYSTYPMFIFLNKLSEATTSIFKFTPLTLWQKKTIVKYFDISLIDIIKISVAKLDKRNYPIWNTQNSNNSCDYKFLLGDGLSLLVNELSFNERTLF